MSVTVSTKIYAYINSVWTELDEVAPSKVSRGMSDNLPETRLGAIGDMSITLNNSTGIYTPGITTGWKKGIPIKMVMTYDNEDYVRFYGAISDIELESKPGQKLVKITALDWFDYASKYPIVNPALLEDSTADEGITTLLDLMPVQPLARSLDTGNIVFPTIFDTVRGNTKAYSEFAKLANSEVGRVYLRADKANGETIVFENSTARNGMSMTTEIAPTTADVGAILLEDGGTLLLEDGGRLMLNETIPVIVENKAVAIDIEYGRNIINRFTTNAYPKREDTASVPIYESERDIFLASGETKTFRIFWRDPNGKRQINARPPSGTTTTKSIVHFNEQNGLKFMDVTGKTWTAQEYDMFRTSIKKFGNGAAYFDGTASYITTPHSADWEFGSGAFTVEWWEYRYTTTSGALAFSRNGAASQPAWRLGQSDGSNLLIYMSSNGTTADIANGKSLGAITTDVWNHFAVSRSGNTFYAFKNGTQTDTWTSSGTLLATTASLSLGRNVSTYLTALIDEIRITKGECLYTASFTAPTEEFNPVGSFVTLWTGENQTGTDITSSLTISTTYGTEGATYTVTNGSSSNGYLGVNVYGYGIYSDSPLEDVQEDDLSITTYGYQNESLQQAYQQELYSGKVEGAKVIELESEPRTVLNSITMCANTSTFLMSVFLNTDVGDLVHIINDKHNLDTMAYIEGLNFTVGGAGVIMFTWILRRAWTLEQGLDHIAVEFDGADSMVNYGYIPAVSADTVEHRLFSAWIYVDTTKSEKQIIQAVYSDQAGEYFYIRQGGLRLGFYSSRTSTPGQWETNSDVISTGVWTHVAVFTYTDEFTLAKKCLFHINGVPLDVMFTTAVSTPSGAAVSEKGAQVMVGNMKTPTVNYTYPFDGKIKDARIYDVTNQTGTGALAINVYNDGVGGTNYYDGVLHQAFVVRTDYLTDYVDTILGTDDKVLDGYMGYVGTPIGSPVGRAV